MNFKFSESQAAIQVNVQDKTFKMNPLHLAAINGDYRAMKSLLEIASQAGHLRKLLNQRDYRGRKPEQIIAPFAANEFVGLPIKNTTTFNFNATIESDMVSRSVKKEFFPLKRQCQRSTYQFLTNATIDRGTAESPTLTIVFKPTR